ncbi:hypothetical protein F4560_004000 [Saccharothrix ecbatanensis]|uniref:Uncharacterized protein n=1 Tax=Saccharothrix ecbatanensis TaxID=1105145 RepID=A0A7W9HKZ4_9PSEU|nr:hypothetical protein [Saccharothrix ecbatanensis]MBB5804232.1 hypothetical protein [Saccharothrix ecbatanensis]
MTARFKRIGTTFALLGVLAVPVGTDYWSINEANDAQVVQPA